MEEKFAQGRPRKQTLEKINLIKDVYNDMLNGAMMSNIIDKLKEGGYGKKYKYDQAYKIFCEAKNLVKLDFAIERPFLKEQLYMYLMDIYTDCRTSNDRYNAIQAINSIAKITGISDEGSKINIESKGDIKISFGFNKDETEEKENTDEVEYEEPEI